MSLKGKRLSPAALETCVQEPSLLELSNHELVNELKRRGLYSKKTYWKDIRINRIREEVFQKLATGGGA